MKPGQRLQEGIVVSHGTDGVLVGREALPGETLPARHTEHRFGATLVFLSNDQAPIPPAGLHLKREAARRATRTPRKGKGK
jgi:hypothetical protein